MALSLSCCNSFNLHNQVKVSQSFSSKKCLENVKNLVHSTGVPSIATPPQESLQRGNWVKLICGASFEDVLDIRNLSLVYTLAGVDCIDCAADASVVSAVNEGIEAAVDIVPLRRPWVMVSVNDDEDLHFRKAAFDPSDCPLDCSRPCEAVCPANAIVLKKGDSLEGGVINERCYGCGRCLPVCPYDNIKAITYVRDAVTTAQLARRNDVDAIEIHTNGRQTAPFEDLWNGMGNSVSHLRLVAVRLNMLHNAQCDQLICLISNVVILPIFKQISLPDVGKSTTTLMNTMFSIMSPNLSCYNLWQLDGRPMSGDIGRGATREALAFAVRLAAAEDKPPGFFQLAGGTNAHTVNGLKEHGLFQINGNVEDGILTRKMSGSHNSFIGGIAYGGYARKIVGRILRAMQSQHGLACVEDHPAYLSAAVEEALALVGSVKCYAELGIDRD
ncbi:NADH-quinone oxidoreductase subunit I 2 [Bienertia sinuspersici]